MKIKTGLSHEKTKGHTFALFGKPSFELDASTPSVAVECHIIAATVKPKSIMGYTFERVVTKLSKYTENKMRNYAKKLVVGSLKRGWVVKKAKEGVGEYIQNDIWNGFIFFVKRK